MWVHQKEIFAFADKITVITIKDIIISSERKKNKQRANKINLNIANESLCNV